MRAKRRLVRHVADLESMTVQELILLAFFSHHATYAVQEGDWRRAYALLHERGWRPGQSNDDRPTRTGGLT